MDEKHAEGRQARVQRPAVFIGAGSQTVNALLSGLPELEGEPIRLEWGSRLRILRGTLNRGPGPGMEVHAAAFPRKRRLVLERSLRADPSELRRIAIHEIFHFVWVRLSNTQRGEWSVLLAAQTTPGELGWSSEWRKNALLSKGFVQDGRAWREYICESFCDTGAWLYAGLRRHEEFTLGSSERGVRKGWFTALLRHRRGRFRI